MVSNIILIAYNIIKGGEDLKQITICVTEQQSELIKKLKEKTGISQNEIVRRSIDEYLRRELKK